MAEGKLSSDTSTDWYLVTDNLGVKISAVFNSGTGTLAVQERIAGSPVTVKDIDGVEVTYTTSFSDPFRFKKDDVFRLNLSGSSTPDIDWKFTGSIVETNLS